MLSRYGVVYDVVFGERHLYFRLTGLRQNWGPGMRCDFSLSYQYSSSVCLGHLARGHNLKVLILDNANHSRCQFELFDGVISPHERLT